MISVLIQLMAFLALSSAAPLARRAPTGPFTLATNSNLPALNGLPIAAHSGYFWIGVAPRYGCYPAPVCSNATIFNQPSGSTGLYTPDNITMYTQGVTQYAYVKSDGRFSYTLAEATDPNAQVSEIDHARGFETMTDYTVDATGATSVLAYTGVFHSGGGNFYACPGPFFYNEIYDPGNRGVNSASYQIYVDTESSWAENPAAKGCLPISLVEVPYTGTTPVSDYS